MKTRIAWFFGMLCAGLLLGMVLAPPTCAQGAIRGMPKRANALSTTVVTVNGTGATLDGIVCDNPNSTRVFLQVFNTSNGTSVSLGTTTPTQSFSMTSGGISIMGWDAWFNNGIKVAATTTATGASAPTTAIDCNFVIR